MTEHWTEADHGPGCDGPLNCTCSQSPTLEPWSPEEIRAAGCVAAAPDPGCYGCLGTGRLQWTGIAKNPCLCVQRCATHDRPFAGEPVCDLGEELLTEILTERAP